MSQRPLLIVVLAAGKGTRMKSALPKVLHRVAGRSLVGHVLAAADAAGADRIAVVVGPDMADLRREVGREAPGALVLEQPDQKGTADAVRAARTALESHSGDIIVLLGDAPLLTPATIVAARQKLAEGSDAVVIGFEAADPTGYGRVITGPDGRVEAIREHKDASGAERQLRLCNSGILGFRGTRFLEILDAIGNANAKGEFYLTDAIEIGKAKGLAAAAIVADEAEVMGINDRAQLATAEAIFQARKRLSAMAEGATLMAPETVFFSHDTRLGQDVVIEPFVVFGPGVAIEDGVTIRAFSHLTGTDAKSSKGTRVGAGAEIGPFARLRPGADLGRNVHVGNFVEVKNVTLEDDAKANHLSYLGDGRVGAAANIGAGTIFCNYDGFNKHLTDVGAGAFVGSNSSLVAPVKIGDGAYIGSGSVITRDVPAGALALERSQQEERLEWAEKFRAVMKKRKGR